MQSVQEFYEQNVRVRSAAERLQLATLILNDIPPQAVVDYSETWLDEDVELLPNAWGSTDYIKPDRMVFRFLEQALGRRIGMEESVTLLRQASQILQQDYPHITPRSLDGEIWKYQRQQ